VALGRFAEYLNKGLCGQEQAMRAVRWGVASRLLF